MYPSLIWFGLLLISVLVIYVMRRRPWYVLAWFAALAVIGWLMPPFSLHVDCVVTWTCSELDTVAGKVTQCSSAPKCIEHAVPDPYSFLVKLFSSLTFIFTVVASLYWALKEGVLRRLW